MYSYCYYLFYRLVSSIPGSWYDIVTSYFHVWRGDSVSGLPAAYAPKWISSMTNLGSPLTKTRVDTIFHQQH